MAFVKRALISLNDSKTLPILVRSILASSADMKIIGLLKPQQSKLDRGFARLSRTYLKSIDD